MHHHEHNNDLHIKYDKSLQAVCFGEILFDHIDSKLHLGGAPLNFAYYLAQLGISAGMVSAVGRDELGDRALDLLQKANIDCRWVNRNDHMTGIVEVSLVGGQPSYEIVEGVAWDYITAPDNIGGDLFYMGTLAQRTQSNHDTAHRIAHNDFKVVFLDVNLRQHYYSPQVIFSSLSHSTFVKMSEEEWPVISKITDMKSIPELLAKYKLQGVALTKGERGAELYTDSGKLSHPGFPSSVVDAVGAGDAFSAVIAASLLKKMPFEEALELSCKVGAYVVGNAGAQVPLEDNIIALFDR